MRETDIEVQVDVLVRIHVEFNRVSQKIMSCPLLIPLLYDGGLLVKVQSSKWSCCQELSLQVRREDEVISHRPFQLHLQEPFLWGA